MYHGGSYSGVGEMKGTIWFTKYKSDAKYYAKQIGGHLTKAKLNYQNPLNTRNFEVTECMIKSSKERNLNVDFTSSFIETNAATLIAQDCGYDAVIDGDNGDVVVFSFDNIDVIEVL